MNEVFYTVQVGDCDRKFREGTTYLDIAKEYQHKYDPHRDCSQPQAKTV